MLCKFVCGFMFIEASALEASKNTFFFLNLCQNHSRICFEIPVGNSYILETRAVLAAERRVGSNARAVL